MVGVASAASIQIGDHELRPNEPNQRVPIFVTGGEQVAGLNFYAQVGDGGPELENYGGVPGTDGPAITAVNLKERTIFSTVSGNQDDQTSIPQVAIASVEFRTPGKSTAANGLLAELTLDTTGFFEGSWDLRLSGVLDDFPGGPFDTDFAGIPITISNGAIRLQGGVDGDVNDDGRIDANDIDLIVDGILGNAPTDGLDLDGSSVVDASDVIYLVKSILKTSIGDANLDGVFGSSDMVKVFIAGKYETGQEAGWGEGDWNSDGRFNTRDLVAAFQDGGYDQGFRPNVVAVPEPNSVLLMTFAIGAISLGCRRRQS